MQDRRSWRGLRAKDTFPNHGLQVLSACVHFIGVTILTHFLSRRLSAENLTSRKAWANITWPRLCILLVFIDSYLFILAGGLLISGVGLRRNGNSCAAGIYLCVVFYASSKVLIYAFLTEKVYVVWENGVRRRLKSPLWLLCMGTIALYVGIIVAMLLGRISGFNSDGVCIIGLKPTASLPLLAYDLYINILLTSLFMWPLVRMKSANPRLKRIATRTLVASMAALTTSTVNITVLTVLHGREMAWLCLGSCGIDVVLNAGALFWVTSGRAASNSQTNSPAECEKTPAVSRAGSSSQLSSLKPFHLRPKRVAVPAPFQVRVTTTSEVETSPPFPTVELPPDAPVEEQKEPCEHPKGQELVDGTRDTVCLFADEPKGYSEADSQKTL